MSANGVKLNGTEYQKTKWQADELLKQSGLNWTIFRPSLIFGDPRGHGRPEFCTQIRKDMLSLPLPAPLFYEGIWPSNAGLFSMTPIHVDNVAEFFVKALNMKNCKGKIYNLGGPETLTWKTIIHYIALASKKRSWGMPVPVFAVKMIAALLDQFEWFPVTRDQLTMLMEGNTVDDHYFNEFSIIPRHFIKDNLGYLSN
jgi:NADH dehydrogenase